MHKKPSGYRVAHHGYLIMYCLRQINRKIQTTCLLVMGVRFILITKQDKFWVKKLILEPTWLTKKLTPFYNSLFTLILLYILRVNIVKLFIVPQLNLFV